MQIVEWRTCIGHSDSEFQSDPNGERQLKPLIPQNRLPRSEKTTEKDLERLHFKADVNIIFTMAKKYSLATKI